MKTIVLLAATAALAACSANAPDTAQREGDSVNTADASEARGQIEAASAAYERALIAGDAAALAQVYTDDFQIIDDDGAIHGKQDQIEFMTEKVDLLNAEGSDVQMTMLGPDAALVTGRYTGRYRMDGKEADFTERYSSVWVRQGGRWQVRHEHTSMVPTDSESRGSSSSSAAG